MGGGEEAVELAPLDGDTQSSQWLVVPKGWPRSAQPGPSPNGLAGQWRRLMPDDGDLTRPAEYIFVPTEALPADGAALLAPGRSGEPSQTSQPAPLGSRHLRPAPAVKGPSPNGKKRKKPKLPKRIKQRMLG